MIIGTCMNPGPNASFGSAFAVSLSTVSPLYRSSLMILPACRVLASLPPANASLHARGRRRLLRIVVGSYGCARWRSFGRRLGRSHILASLPPANASLHARGSRRLLRIVVSSRGHIGG